MLTNKALAKYWRLLLQRDEIYLSILESVFDDLIKALRDDYDYTDIELTLLAHEPPASELPQIMHEYHHLANYLNNKKPSFLCAYYISRAYFAAIKLPKKDENSQTE